MFMPYPYCPFWRDDSNLERKREPWWLTEKHWVYLKTTDKGQVVGYVTFYDSTSDKLHIKAIVNGKVKNITQITSFITKGYYFTSAAQIREPWWLTEKRWVYLKTTDKGQVVGYVTFYDSTSDKLHIKAIMNGKTKNITQLTSFISEGYYFTSTNKIRQHYLKTGTDTNSKVEDQYKITFNDAKIYNQKYFRPCCLPAINTRGLNNLIIDIHNTDPTKINLPKELMTTPINTIINYYSILREATPLTEGGTGCGTVGMLKLPYPIAYNFLSSNYKNKMDYKTYINSFKSISHINLVRLIQGDFRVDTDSNKIKYFVELECIYPPGNFQYNYGIIYLIKEGDNYKIDSIELMPEDFFCAPYHGWQHNAERKIKNMYGNWCQLISVMYPTVESQFTKQIYVYGTDGNNYLFVFMKLTNGTDVEIGRYKLDDFGQWQPLDNNPCDGIKKN